MRQIIAELQRIRRLSRGLLILQRAAVLTAWVLGVSGALVVADFVLRLPEGARFLQLIVGGGVLGYFLARYFAPALRFRPNLTQVALRVERMLPALSGRLASGVEFAMSGTDRTNALAARSIRDAESRLTGESIGQVMRPGRTWRDLAFAAAVIAIVGAGAFASPDAARIGTVRLLLPFGSAKWPARTAVESLMPEVLTYGDVHPRGQVLALRARNLTPNDPGGRVDAFYRVRANGEFQPWQRIVLTHQGGNVHERLVDTNAETIEVYFATDDARTELERVGLIPPPAVRRATLTVTPPSYAEPYVPVLTAELGPGLDDRSVTRTPSLIGSEVTLELRFNKPIPVPSFIDDAERERWLARTFGWYSGAPGALETDPARRDAWTVRWRLEGSRVLTLDLIDEYGLRNPEQISYRIVAVEDRPPAVTIMHPPSDQIVLPTAVVPLAAEAQDDVAVATIGLRADLQRAAPADAAEPRAAPVVEEDAWSTFAAVGETTASFETELDLAALELREGDVVLLYGVSEDVFELDGQRHEPATSPVRRLRVISELELAGQLRRQLGAVRQNAIRVESMQGELQDDVIEDGVQPGMDRAQAQISERIAAQRDAVDDVERQLTENRLDDEQLLDLIRQSRDLLSFAGQAAARAAEAIEQRRREGGSDAAEAPRDGDDDEPRPTAGEDRPIVEAQQEVRDELADLIELLDRDEDTWVITRRLEDMLEQQRTLREATESLSEQTIGQDRENLPQSTRTELDRVAARQRDLRDEARNLVEEMRDRAASLEEFDPQSAAGMREAARSAEQRELDRDLEAAASRVEQNRLQNALADQQAAQRTLERMLDDVQEARRSRAEELLRQLASLLESIERLIFVQETELAALAAARHDDVFAGRDRAMIGLNRNTQAVAAEARAAGQQTRRIARTLDRAADAQGAAVTALRAEPVDADAAEEAENHSLELLQEAKALAEELQQQTEEQEAARKKEELRERYRVFAEQQVTLRDETLELGRAGELDRRQLVEARRLATREEEIRTGMDDLLRTSPELSDAVIFNHTHRLIDDWARVAAETLREGDAGVEVTDRQRYVAESIGRLIEALEDPPPQDEDFADGGSQGGGGGGQQQGQPQVIPPIAQLKLLRGLQELIYGQTRDLDAREDLDAAPRRDRLRDLGTQQRELMQLGEAMLQALGGPGRLQPMPPNPDDAQEDAP